MDVLKRLTLATLALGLLTGCQISYYLNSAYHQGQLLRARVPLEKALAQPDLSPETRHKLLLAQSARVFAEEELGLVHSQNYTSFVQLDRPYVSYIVHAAPKHKLEHHLWRFPIVGSLPYKGYFRKPQALAEAARMERRNFDTFVRGVSAYSTLGWFNDPILSSMLHSSDHRLVNLIIHETVHATIFIKSQADFNERLATFLGDLGTEMYYRQLEGEDSPTLKQIAAENRDQMLFSDFISQEIRALRQWYSDVDEKTALANRETKLSAIQKRFRQDIQPQLETRSYAQLATTPLNNALLLSYQTYYENLDDFQTLFDLMDRNLKQFIDFFKSIESDPQPQARLEEKILLLSSTPADPEPS